jgi:protein-disulfide isomerase
MQPLAASTLKLPIAERDHLRGAADAPVTLVEYGDFECPHCAIAHGIIEEVLNEAGPIVRFCYRHFPLSNMHPHAAIAAQATEAAGVQGKFWEMHDVLFLNQDALDPDDLIGYAEALGLDVDRFMDEMEREVYAERMQEDVEGGRRSGVHGTPTFFINGTRWDGPREVSFILAAIREAAAVRRH